MVKAGQVPNRRVLVEIVELPVVHRQVRKRLSYLVDELEKHIVLQLKRRESGRFERWRRRGRRRRPELKSGVLLQVAPKRAVRLAAEGAGDSEGSDRAGDGKRSPWRSGDGRP